MPRRRLTLEQLRLVVAAARPSSRGLHREVGGWLRIPDGGRGDVAVKPAPYLPTYEELLGPLRAQAFCLLELGVWKGDSLAMWRDAFPRATIVGVDLAPPQLELGPRVHVVTGDQTDVELLAKARAEYAPDGFAVIIDDASHIGRQSAGSLQALFTPHLRPSGLYIIEDWGTGYMTDWPDGADPSSVVGTDELGEGPHPPPVDERVARCLPSHDAGMVGLVKRLVDHTAAGTLSHYHPKWVAEPLQIEWMRVHDGLVILKKPASATMHRPSTS